MPCANSLNCRSPPTIQRLVEMHSQGLLRIDDHYYRELIFSLCRDFLRLESLARASSLSSGKMIDRHMTRKHGFAGWGAASCRRWLPLNQLNQSDSKHNLVANRAEMLFGRGLTHNMLSVIFRQAYRSRVTLIKRFFCINNSSHCKASATRSATK